MLEFSDQHVLARFGAGDIGDVDERDDDALGLAIAAAIGRQANEIVCRAIFGRYASFARLLLS